MVNGDLTLNLICLIGPTAPQSLLFEDPIPRDPIMWFLQSVRAFWEPSLLILGIVKLMMVIVLSKELFADIGQFIV